jgi:glycosyltransferase involved in cell wall biosynthesis
MYLSFPHQPEGQPIVIIEALAAGLPVIATARGAIPAMVLDGVNGFIVPEHDPEAIAVRLTLLRENPSLRLSMGRASRALFEEHFTEEKFVQGFAAILEKVIGAH